MNDQEASGIVLKRLYDLRKTGTTEIADFADTGLASDTVSRILEQLAQQGLIDWNPIIAGFMNKDRYLAVMAKINAFGVNVIEGTEQPPIAIKIDQSVNVHGSQGVQIGGSGNVQNINLTLDKLNNYIDSSVATTREKENAKGLLAAALENPLVQKAIQWLMGGTS
jgi:hypothetical protein